MSVWDLAFLLPLMFGGAAVMLALVALGTYLEGPRATRARLAHEARRAQRRTRARENRLRRSLGLRETQPRPTRHERSSRGWF